MWKRGLIPLIVLSFFATIWGVYEVEVSRPHTGEGETLIKIIRGDNIRTVAKKLAKAGIISSPILLEFETRIRRQQNNIRAGEFLFPRNLSVKQTVAHLVEGKEYLYPISIPEGFTIKQIAKKLDDMNLVKEDEFNRVAHDPALLHSLKVPGESAEGFLFPETYNFPKTITAQGAVKKMVNTFYKKVSAMLPKRIMEDSQRLRKLITLASLVEKETGSEKERGLIASVFTNRLRKGIALQCDPTVIYALPEFNGNLRKKDLLFDSPYNTYMYKGLPPGPIANPGLDSIHSAWRPAKTGFFYFVSMNNGEHYFSRSLAEHNKAVRKYQIKRGK